MEFAAQYQQAPVPLGGNLIKWLWFKFYERPPCRSRKSHPRGFAPEGESGQHHKRCLPSSICLRCSSPICSNRDGSWKSRTSFFVTSSRMAGAADGGGISLGYGAALFGARQ